MHYIRFLKLPSLTPQPKSSTNSFQLTAKITVTSDLGESFLCHDLTINALIIDADNHHLPANRKELTWKAGSRQLEISLPVVEDAKRPLGKLKWPCRLVVVAGEERFGVRELRDVLLEGGGEWGAEGGVLGLESEPLERRTGGSAARRVLRMLRLDEGKDRIAIWEETRESIARHIWDAGLLLSAYLSTHAPTTQRTKPIPTPNRTLPQHHPPPLTSLQALLATPHRRVLELGSGCGIVGLTFAKCYPSSTVLLTDLPEAEEIARHNLNYNFPTSSHFPSSSTKTVPPPSTSRASTPRYTNLDWSNPLPTSLPSFDLILLSDCTYNPVVIPHLVTTLSTLLTANPHALILLATKVRHESEVVFFDLMRERDIGVRDKVVLPLPVLGDEAQEIEVYVFGRGVGVEREG